MPPVGFEPTPWVGIAGFKVRCVYQFRQGGELHHDLREGTDQEQGSLMMRVTPTATTRTWG